MRPTCASDVNTSGLNNVFNFSFRRCTLVKRYSLDAARSYAETRSSEAAQCTALWPLEFFHSHDKQNRKGISKNNSMDCCSLKAKTLHRGCVVSWARVHVPSMDAALNGMRRALRRVSI